VPQRMGCDRFGNAATSLRLLARLFYGVLADVAAGKIAREKPWLGFFHSPPVAQDFQQLGREHDVAILLPLALFDANGHPLAIDVGGF
jgi:hypothetical protein